MVSRIVAELQSRGFLVWFDCEWTKTNTLTWPLAHTVLPR
jgi:hypothetical protein